MNDFGVLIGGDGGFEMSLPRGIELIEVTIDNRCCAGIICVFLILFHVRWIDCVIRCFSKFGYLEMI